MKGSFDSQRGMTHRLKTAALRLNKHHQHNYLTLYITLCHIYVIQHYTFILPIVLFFTIFVIHGISMYYISHCIIIIILTSQLSFREVEKLVYIYPHGYHFQYSFHVCKNHNFLLVAISFLQSSSAGD